jgi:acetyl esterase/lipase
MLAQFGSKQTIAPSFIAESPLRFLTSVVRGLGEPGAVRETRVGYAAADGSPLELVVFNGPEPGPRPTVISIYGGAWRGGTTEQGAEVNRHLAQRGFTVVAIDYRHAPRHRHPAQIDDVRHSLEVIRDSAQAWRVDRDRVAVLGRSAGGHLAMLTGFSPVPTALTVRAVVALYAPFNLEQGYTDLPDPDPIGVQAVLRDYLGGTPDEVPAEYRNASPSTFVRPGLPPTLLIYGGHDNVVKPEFGAQAAQRLREVGDTVVFAEFPVAEHGFDLVPRGMRARLALDVIEEFLTRTIGRSS